MGQIETSNRKTLVDIAATAKLWIQDMDYAQYRPDAPFKNKLALIHVLLRHFDLIPHKWQMMAFGSSRSMKQQNSGGHCSNSIFMDSGHGL
jgi:hypothetical protein